MIVQFINYVVYSDYEVFAMFIAYDKKGNAEYTKLCVSKRNGKTVSKTYIHLGRVIDKEKGIYRNRARSIFTYQLDTNSYGTVDAAFIPEATNRRRKEQLILDFGDTFFLDRFLRQSGMKDIVDANDCYM